MSESKEKKRRRILEENYRLRLLWWELSEPPKWRVIAYRKWKNEKPKRTW